MGEESKQNGGFQDLAKMGLDAGINFLGTALTNPLESWSGDSNKNKQKKLMHYQDVINQKSLTESPSSMRLGYETAGFSPALALGQSAPTVGLGSSQMGHKDNPFNDLLSKNQQRKLMQSQAELQKIHNFTDMVDSLGKNVEPLEKAGFDVSGMFKRIANDLNIKFPVLKDAPSKVREHVESQIADLLAGAGLKDEQKKTEVTKQSLNKATETLTNAQTDTEYTKQDLNQVLARLNDEKVKTESAIRHELNTRANLQHWQKKEIEETFGFLWQKMHDSIALIQEQTNLAIAQRESASYDAQLKQQALEVEKAYTDLKKKLADEGIMLLTESDKDDAVIKTYWEQGHYGRVVLYYVHKVLNAFNGGASVTKTIK